VSKKVFIYDNSEGDPKLIAEKQANSNLIIINKQKYYNLLEYYDTKR
jgi:predicted ABC-type ATPase